MTQTFSVARKQMRRPDTGLTLCVRRVDARPAALSLEIPLELPLWWLVNVQVLLFLVIECPVLFCQCQLLLLLLHALLPELDSFRNVGLASDGVALSGHGDPDSVGHVLHPLGLLLALDSAGQQGVAGSVPGVHDALLGECRDEDEGGNIADLCLEGLVHLLARIVELLRPGRVNLVDDDKDGLVGEKRLDGLEELDLSLEREAALLGEVEEVHDAAAQVGERGDGLHLDRVHLLERVVEHSRRVDDLPAEVLVVHVPDKQRLGRKSVRLHVDVRAGDLVDEG